MIFFLNILVVSLSFANEAARAREGASARTFSNVAEHAVLLVIDGLSYKVWDRMDLPVLEKMIESGALVEKTYLPPAAHPASGPYAELHSGSIPNPIMMAGTVFITKKTGYLQDSFFPSRIAAFVANSSAYRTLVNNYHYVYQKDGTDEESIQTALKFMEMGKPAFMRIHLQDAGSAGSESMTEKGNYPWRWNIWAENSPYRTAVSHADKLVGDFIDGLEKLGILQKTVFIVMGDHGQDDTGWHPSEFVDSAITTTVLWGAGIKKGVRIPYSELIDIVPTICWLMRVKPPKTCLGRAIAEGLEGYPEPFPPRKLLMKELLYQIMDYRKRMTDAMYKVENLSSPRRGFLFTRLSREIRENFYGIERFSEWPRFNTLDELVEHNRKVMERLNTIIEEIDKIDK